MHALQRRDDRGREAEAGPRGKHALGEVNARRPMAVVGEARAGAEGIGEFIHKRRLGWGPERSGGELEALILTGQHHGARRGELKPLSVV